MVSGRDQAENERIVELAQEGDLLFEVQGVGSPVTLLRGAADEEAIRLAAAITARYSDARAAQVAVHYGPAYAHLKQSVEVERPAQGLLDRMRI